MNQQLAFWVMFVLVLTRPEIKGSKAIANDSELQSCDSQDDSEDEAQEDCSEIGSSNVVLKCCSRRSRRKRYNTKERIQLNLS